MIKNLSLSESRRSGNHFQLTSHNFREGTDHKSTPEEKGVFAIECKQFVTTIDAHPVMNVPSVNILTTCAVFEFFPADIQSPDEHKRSKDRIGMP